MKIEHKIFIEEEYSDILLKTQFKSNLSTIGKAVEKFIHEGSEEFSNIPFDKYSIHNRRYMGSKTKLLNFIDKSINKEIGDFTSFVDIFSGTGVVGNYFNTENRIIYSNDLLYSNFITNSAFLSDETYDYEKLNELIKRLNNIEGRTNYFSKHYGNKFFSLEISKKIGTIREQIEKLYKNKEINFREKCILITSLIYTSDKIANTCGHYDAYRENAEFKDNFELKHIDIFHSKNQNNKTFNEDANELFKVKNGIGFKVDIIYADPPYNSRQYISSYHLLENLAKWDKPEVEGKVGKRIDRNKFNSKYCTKSAIESFENLIENVNSKYFILSYSNMEKKGNDRSNSRMDDKDIIRILESKGDLIIKSENHQVFSTGKTEINNHQERLFILKFK
jgi:adenine-specific DNA-methyltransferase